MTKKTVVVRIPTAAEVRPVAMLVQLANQFTSSIHIENGNKRYNAKSIMGMMTLGLVSGEELTLTAEGSDESVAVNKIESYLTGTKD